MDESLDILGKRLSKISEGINFAEMVKDSHSTVDEMINELSQDIDRFKKTGECSDKLHAFMQVHGHSKKQMIENPCCVPGAIVYFRGRAGKVDRVEGDKCFVHIGGGNMDVWPTSQCSDKKQSMVDVFKKDVSTIGQGLKGFMTGGPEPIDEELNELARLAGLEVNEVDRGDYLKQKDAEAEKAGKDKFTAFGQEFDTDEVSEDTCSTCHKDPCECEVEEGNKFGKTVVDAKKDGIQPGEKIKIDGKELPLKEAEELVAMLRAAGMDSSKLEEAIRLAEGKSCTCDKEVHEETCPMHEEAIEEAAVEVKDAKVKPVNKPDPKYATLKGSTMGPGEGDPGEKQMNPDRPTYKNGDNAMAKPPVRESNFKLADTLMAEYESIKKVS